MRILIQQFTLPAVLQPAELQQTASGLRGRAVEEAEWAEGGALAGRFQEEWGKALLGAE
jgi:hypothetical protein